MEPKAPISPADFAACDLRVGTIVGASLLENARQPAYVLQLDFGPLGMLKSTAQLAADYTAIELIGKQIVAVVNFPPRQIGKVMSEILVLGVPDEAGKVVLMRPDQDVPIGGLLF